jgi:cAMP-dependent protein kinase regulator
VTQPADGALPDALEIADALVVRGELDRAEEVLREGLRTDPESMPLREDLANLLVRRGRPDEAAALLDEVATFFAKAGMPGRAIAALKKLARFRPEALQDAGRRIAALARQRGHEPAPAGDAARRPAAGPEGGVASQARRSPLFDDFSADELAAVIQGLDLRSVAPGDLVVTQGEPGQSLFVVVSGSLKVWVREGEGRSRHVRNLVEGDFFGEVSLLTGRPRTATIAAAARADLLELGWPRVEEIVRDHPRVADVLRAFCDERLEADASGRGAS